MSIRDLSSLQQHLQWAIELEHATIPPYLFALYSIKEGCNLQATEILRSIFMEEMLHMTLAANVLNAVGGTPRLTTPGFIPEYPAYLPHSRQTFLVPLAGFSPETIRTLMQIERPEAVGAPAEEDRYETIGQFYEAIREGLKFLSAQLGQNVVFSGDSRHQIENDKIKYAGSGRIIPVTELDSALAALDEIMHQGEGLDHDAIWDGDRNMFHHERDEVGHYFRLREILDGRHFQRGDTPQTGPTGESFPVDWDAVYRPRSNPSTADYAMESEISDKMRKFSLEYSEILEMLERGFNGEAEYISRSVGSMYELRQGAMELMSMPSGDGATTAGICFDYRPGEFWRETGNIKILPDGPYRIQGGIPLVRKNIIRSEYGEALAWRMDGEVETLPDYALCRCGNSSIKPFCDGSHATTGFDGTEIADSRSYAELQNSYPGKSMIMHDHRSLCIHAGFCHNRVSDAWKLVKKTADTQVLIQLIGMIEHCPSGALSYTLTDALPQNDTDNSPEQASRVGIEPGLALAIAVIPDGPLWVTGGVPVVRSDGVVLEIRNRVTLCRCGHSKNKPFCDGSHAEVGFSG